MQSDTRAPAELYADYCESLYQTIRQAGQNEGESLALANNIQPFAVVSNFVRSARLQGFLFVSSWDSSNPEVMERKKRAAACLLLTASGITFDYPLHELDEESLLAQQAQKLCEMSLERDSPFLRRVPV